ncbi:hypothetical protein BCR42DRAFT_398657 [Absidia repens]|uniref:Uncharacterized protein n=1 Tax=Absidia repens TaxID=90262 RepID=A0A1X2HXM4_9FUNG|nr:hypothetical protein BCR42DRAFT_398657 [Absidia repens]
MVLGNLPSKVSLASGRCGSVEGGDGFDDGRDNGGWTERTVLEGKGPVCIPEGMECGTIKLELESSSSMGWMRIFHGGKGVGNGLVKWKTTNKKIRGNSGINDQVIWMDGTVQKRHSLVETGIYFYGANAKKGPGRVAKVGHPNTSRGTKIV